MKRASTLAAGVVLILTKTLPPVSSRPYNSKLFGWLMH